MSEQLTTRDTWPLHNLLAKITKHSDKISQVIQSFGQFLESTVPPSSQSQQPFMDAKLKGSPFNLKKGAQYSSTNSLRPIVSPPFSDQENFEAIKHCFERSANSLLKYLNEFCRKVVQCRNMQLQIDHLKREKEIVHQAISRLVNVQKDAQKLAAHLASQLTVTLEERDTLRTEKEDYNNEIKQLFVQNQTLIERHRHEMFEKQRQLMYKINEGKQKTLKASDAKNYEDTIRHLEEEVYVQREHSTELEKNLATKDCEIAKLSELLKSSEADNDKIITVYQQEIKQLNDKLFQRKEAIARLEGLLINAEDTHRREIKGINQNNSQIKQQKEAVDHQIDHLNRQLSSTREALQRVEASNLQVSSIQQKSQKQDQQIQLSKAKLTEQIAQLQSALKNAEEEAQQKELSYNKACSEFEEKLCKQVEEIKLIVEAFESNRTRLKESEKSNASLSLEIKNLKEQNEKINLLVDKRERQKSDLQFNLGLLQSVIKDLRDKFSGLEKELQKTVGNNQQLTKENVKLKQLQASARKGLAKLEQLESSLGQKTRQNQLLSNSVIPFKNQNLLLKQTIKTLSSQQTIDELKVKSALTKIDQLGLLVANKNAEIQDIATRLKLSLQKETNLQAQIQLILNHRKDRDIQGMAELEKLQIKMKNEASIFQEVQNQKNTLKTQNIRLALQVAEHNSRSDSLLAQCVKLQEQLTEVTEQLAGVEANLRRSQQQLTKIQQELTNKQTELEKRKQEIQKINKQKQLILAELEETQLSEDTLNDQVAKLNQKYVEQTAILSYLQMKLNSLSSKTDDGNLTISSVSQVNFEYRMETKQQNGLEQIKVSQELPQALVPAISEEKCPSESEIRLHKIVDSLNLELNQTKDQLIKLETTCKQLLNQNSLLENQKEQLNKLISHQRALIDQSKKESSLLIENHQLVVSKLNEINASLQEGNKISNQRLRELEQKNRQAQQMSLLHEHESKELERQINHLKLQNQALVIEKYDLNCRMQQIDESYKLVQSQNQSQEGRTKDIVQQNKRLIQQNQQLQSQVSMITQNLSSLIDQSQSAQLAIEQKTADAAKAYQELQAQCQSLNQQLLLFRQNQKQTLSTQLLVTYHQDQSRQTISQQFSSHATPTNKSEETLKQTNQSASAINRLSDYRLTPLGQRVEVGSQRSDQIYEATQCQLKVPHENSLRQNSLLQSVFSLLEKHATILSQQYDGCLEQLRQINLYETDTKSSSSSPCSSESQYEVQNESCEADSVENFVLNDLEPSGQMYASREIDHSSGEMEHSGNNSDRIECMDPQSSDHQQSADLNQLEAENLTLHQENYDLKQRFSKMQADWEAQQQLRLKASLEKQNEYEQKLTQLSKDYTHLNIILKERELQLNMVYTLLYETQMNLNSFKANNSSDKQSQAAISKPAPALTQSQSGIQSKRKSDSAHYQGHQVKQLVIDQSSKRQLQIQRCISLVIDGKQGAQIVQIQTGENKSQKGKVTPVIRSGRCATDPNEIISGEELLMAEDIPEFMVSQRNIFSQSDIVNLSQEVQKRCQQLENLQNNIESKRIELDSLTIQIQEAKSMLNSIKISRETKDVCIQYSNEFEGLFDNTSAKAQLSEASSLKQELNRISDEKEAFKKQLQWLKHLQLAVDSPSKTDSNYKTGNEQDKFRTPSPNQQKELNEQNSQLKQEISRSDGLSVKLAETERACQHTKRELSLVRTELAIKLEEIQALSEELERIVRSEAKGARDLQIMSDQLDFEKKRNRQFQEIYEKQKQKSQKVVSAGQIV